MLVGAFHDRAGPGGGGGRHPVPHGHGGGAQRRRRGDRQSHASLFIAATGACINLVCILIFDQVVFVANNSIT